MYLLPRKAGLRGSALIMLRNPSESLALIADAWGVSLDGPKKKTPEQQAARAGEEFGDGRRPFTSRYGAPRA